uniref:Uncharacterized protein n=1 Tax=Lotharella globosa TaxID=91324 RepID=A0A7S4DXP4_9EUKA
MLEGLNSWFLHKYNLGTSALTEDDHPWIGQEVMIAENQDTIHGMVIAWQPYSDGQNETKGVFTVNFENNDDPEELSEDEVYNGLEGIRTVPKRRVLALYKEKWWRGEIVKVCWRKKNPIAVRCDTDKRKRNALLWVNSKQLRFEGEQFEGEIGSY